MLNDIGHAVEARTVAMLLQKDGYSLEMNRQSGREGTGHPDRSEQCAYIAERVREFDERREPAVVVELMTSKRSREGRHPETEVEGFTTGISRGTAALCAAAIEGWWKKLGRTRFPKVKQLMIAADSGHGADRGEPWHVALQHLANRIRLELSAHYFPPVTARWRNRGTCSYTMVWEQVKPPTRFWAHVDLVGKLPRTKTAQKRSAVLEEQCTELPGVGRVELRIERQKRLPAWNCSIRPG